jgi:hypothetical protein
VSLFAFGYEYFNSSFSRSRTSGTAILLVIASNQTALKYSRDGVCLETKRISASEKVE